MRLLHKLLVFVMVQGMVPQAWACNPYMSPSSPYFNPAKFQMVFASTGGITKQEYDEMIAQTMAYFGPIVTAKGGTLEIPDEWNDNMVNGFARREENIWRIHLLGGYARHPQATKDAFMFLICHEMGHQVGGTPFYPGSYSWASAEGQADYYATLKCMREMYKNDDNEAAVAALNVPAVLREKCEQQHSVRLDQLLCIRGAMGGYQMTQIWEEGRGTFAFDTPSAEKTTETYYYHPANQCRIDTYMQGALCAIPSHVDVDGTDAKIGTCNVSTAHTVGLRPECWYKEAL